EGGTLGRVLLAISRTIATRIDHSQMTLAAASALAKHEFSGRRGRWGVASITHAFWVAANLGMLAMLALSFVGEGYRFRWDSTWLSADNYAALISALGAAPEAMGFAVPDEQAIALSRRAVDDRTAWPIDASEDWSWLFFGSVIVYGLLPRVVFLILSLVWRSVATRRSGLDVEHPDFAELRDRLGLRHARIGSLRSGSPTISSDLESSFPRIEVAEAQPDAAHTGNVAIAGLEIREPATGWPPALDASAVTDLGLIDGAATLHKAAQALHSGDASRAARLLIVCELGCTPDRGIAHQIVTLQRAARTPISIVLSAGREFSDGHGTDATTRRVADWHTLADRIGISREDVHTIDLDHLTATTQAQLRAIANHPEQHASAGDEHITEACEIIRARAQKWPVDSHISERMLADVMHDIASLYKHTRKRWTARLAPDLDGLRTAIAMREAEPIRASMQQAANRFLDMLPAGLRMQPRWAAAGALAGGLGCITAATLLSPVAIGSLPIWSLIGAGVAAFLPKHRSQAGSGGDVERDDANGDIAQSFDEAVRAAFLFAAVLELQGRSEAEIATVLDAVADAEPSGAQRITRSSLEAWLDNTLATFNASASALSRSQS
ncbi:MAG: DUF2868 domain-containing protein, partial [Phycisphaerales bacterium]